MAASRTPRPKPADPAAQGNPAAAALARAAIPSPVAVAYSGGADSTALLHAAAAHWPAGQLHAFHVHHGLQPAADGFDQHCRAACAALGVPLQVLRTDARHAPGESPEDAARRARYAALAQAAREQGVATVLLAQHADDQAETLLLALSRGAGLPGLAAMAPAFERHGMRFARPLLDVRAAALREWLRTAGLAWVEDPSNADVHYTRNRIRHQLLPALDMAFPGFRETFARSSRHAAQAQALLDEVAAADLAAVRGTAGDGAGGPRIADGAGGPRIAALRPLSRPRQANLLRHWLREAHATAPSAAQLEELLDQVAACATRGHRIRIKVGLGFVERAGEVLAFATAGLPRGR